MAPALCAVLAGCSSTTAVGGRTASTSSTAGVTTTQAPTTTTTTDPGALPQTPALPSPSTAQFQTEMTALWNGVLTDSSSTAMPAFFPESAYLQVKTVADPAADYRDRLVAEFAADVDAAHALLDTSAGPALVEVSVPQANAHWVPPGVCANRVGYYEVANSRVVYSQRGAVRSFGIASLISWRGVWYVVHLGAIVRSGPGGVVDDPAAGPGSSAPSSSC